MNIEDLARPEIRGQRVYEAGRPIEHVAREFGLKPEDILKLASNENPLGTSPKALAAAQAALRDARLYPDAACYDLTHKAAAVWNLSPAQFVFGNGSNEILELLTRTFLLPGDEVIMGQYAFIIYRLLTSMAGATLVDVPMRADFAHDLEAMRKAVTPRTKLIFLTNPNNPTGGANTRAEAIAFARSLPDHVILCVDEAYAEFMDEAPDFRELIAEGRPILCCRTFSKIYGCAGFRAGYGYGPEALVGLLQRARQPFNMNLVAQAAALAAFDDIDFVKRSRENNRAGIVLITRRLGELGVVVPPTQANFVFFRVGPQAVAIGRYLQKHGVIVRTLVPYGLAEYLRVTVGTPEQNERFLEVFARALASGGSA